jgi:hypothetical protein
MIVSRYNQKRVVLKEYEGPGYRSGDHGPGRRRLSLFVLIFFIYCYMQTLMTLGVAIGPLFDPHVCAG